jgi:hypothetical protein
MMDGKSRQQIVTSRVVLVSKILSSKLAAQLCQTGATNRVALEMLAPTTSLSSSCRRKNMQQLERGLTKEKGHVRHV